jgi:heterotetrameric sarcosine oxidase gamma subunit
VASWTLVPRSGLEHLVGVRGAPEQNAGVTLALRSDLALATVMVRSNQHAALAARVRDAFGLDLPTSPRRAACGPVAFAWAGPGQWLAMAEGADALTFEARLRVSLSELCAISRQSDGRTVIRVGGHKARAALAKGMPIDLDPRAFGPDATALTHVDHMAVHLWRIDAPPAYELAVFRSYAAALWEWLVDASGEFGVAVTGN